VRCQPFCFDRGTPVAIRWSCRKLTSLNLAGFKPRWAICRCREALTRPSSGTA
jgi:hypothetical protein